MMARSTDDRAKFAELLRRLAECVEHSSADAVDELIAGRARLQIVGASKERPLRTRRDERDEMDWFKIADRLKAFGSRDAGEHFIDELALTRMDLERLARAMDLPVAKNDNLTRLREKIIESSIGSRLASLAIRGDFGPPKDK